jgi:hypothetical protein
MKFSANIKKQICKDFNLDNDVCKKCLFYKHIYDDNCRTDIGKVIKKIVFESFFIGGEKMFGKYKNIFHFDNVNEKLLEYFFLEQHNYKTTDILNKILILPINKNYRIPYGSFYNMAHHNINYIKILLDAGFDGDLEKYLYDCIYNLLDDKHNLYMWQIIYLIKTKIDIANINCITKITGMQYDDRDWRVEIIKELVKKNMIKKENVCISKCENEQTCKFHKMLYDTRLGKVLLTL